MRFLRNTPSFVLVALTSACGGTIALGAPADAQATSGSVGSSGSRSIASGSTASGSTASGSTASGSSAAGAVNGAGAPDASSCLPLSTAPCPADWTAALADRGRFCMVNAGSPLGYDAVVSTAPCRGLWRYTRFLFDAGPRYCVYDPSTLALRGYYAHDGKAGVDAITCGATPADFDMTGCAGASCPGADASVDSSVSGAGSFDAGSFPQCGTTCSGSQICIGLGGGPLPPPGRPYGSYSCAPIPPTCTTRATCACIAAYHDGGFSLSNDPCWQYFSGAGGTCLDDGAGHVTLECALP